MNIRDFFIKNKLVLLVVAGVVVVATAGFAFWGSGNLGQGLLPARISPVSPVPSQQNQAGATPSPSPSSNSGNSGIPNLANPQGSVTPSSPSFNLSDAAGNNQALGGAGSGVAGNPQPSPASPQASGVSGNGLVANPSPSPASPQAVGISGSGVVANPQPAGDASNSGAADNGAVNANNQPNVALSSVGLKDLKVDPNPYVRLPNSAVTFHYTLTTGQGSAPVDAVIFKLNDAAQTPVKSWLKYQSPEGVNSLQWTGNSNAGTRVSDGDYVFQVTYLQANPDTFVNGIKISHPPTTYTKSVPFKITPPPALQVSCSGTPANVSVNAMVTWKAVVQNAPAGTVFSYQWSGDHIAGANVTAAEPKLAYDSDGVQHASVVVSAPNFSASVATVCTPVTVEKVPANNQANQGVNGAGSVSGSGSANDQSPADNQPSAGNSAGNNNNQSAGNSSGDNGGQGLADGSSGNFSGQADGLGFENSPGPVAQNNPAQAAPAPQAAAPAPANNASGCAGFSDVPAKSAVCDAITYVKSTGSMTGVSANLFAPNEDVQRDQAAKIVLEIFKAHDENVDYCSNDPQPYLDTEANDWSREYQCQAKTEKTITGYLAGPWKGRFLPAKAVSRAEFLAILLRKLLKVNTEEKLPVDTHVNYSDVAPGLWFSRFAAYAFKNHLFSGTKFSGSQFMTRADVAVLLYQLHQLGKF